MAAVPLTTPFRVVGDGVEVRVKAEPRARRPGVGGMAPGADGPRLRIAVTEAPSDGKASEAVAQALARALGLPGRTVTLRSGAASRAKTLHVAGDAATLLVQLEGFCR